jgi:MOSC domain-containing protein YiiM
MKLISVNVGLPREVTWNGGTVKTGIFKQPVQGSIRVRLLNVDGDKQADLSVYGGPDKAVYAYPVEHYAYWRRELPDRELTWGSFGENLITEGLDESVVQIGDRFRIGTAEFVVTQPRLPCYKLGIRFERPDLVKRFLASRRTGFYFAVAQEGALSGADPIELVTRETKSLTVAEITRLYAFQKDDREMLQRAVRLEALPENWRSYFRSQLEKIAR